MDHATIVEKSNTDYFNRRLRKPRSLKLARLMGETAFRTLRQATLDRPLTKDEEAMVVRLGHAIGEEMYRDGSTWTLNQFINRLGKVANAA